MLIEKLKITDVNLENAEHLIRLCIPPDKWRDPLFQEGMKAKKKWVSEALRKYGSVAKLAYLNSKPVGLIQYEPRPEERLVEIECIFVPEKEHLRKGVGRSLLSALIEDAKSKHIIGEDVPLALTTYAFQVPGWFPQHEFYKRMGFKRAKEDDPFLLYYPIKEDYVHILEEGEFVPQEDDKGKVLIFHGPSCPWSIYFSEKIKESIREVAPDIPIRMIDMFWEKEEVRKRGKTPACAVNGVPIKSFFMDKENFQREVKQAIHQN